MGKKVSRAGAVAALVSTPTIKEAAKLAGISEKTLHKWLDEPEFFEEVRAAQGKVTSAAISQAARYMGRALEVLAVIMEDSMEPTSARVAAARALLDAGFKSFDKQPPEPETGRAGVVLMPAVAPEPSAGIPCVEV